MPGHTFIDPSPQRPSPTGVQRKKVCYANETLVVTGVNVLSWPTNCVIRTQTKN